MKEEIIILNVLRYEQDEKHKNSGCRLGFIFADETKFSDTSKFKGYAELSMFYDYSIFDKFTKDMFYVPAMATFKNLPNPTNPLRSRTVIESIDFNGNVINLL